MAKFIIRTVAPASLASALLMLVSGWESAQGRTFQPGTCTNRHAACADRCLIKSGNVKIRDDLGSCIRRTCNPQYDNCVKTQGNRPIGSAGVKGGGVATDPKGTGTRPPLNKWHGPVSPPKGGTWQGPGPVPKAGTWQGQGGSGPILKSGGKR